MKTILLVLIMMFSMVGLSCATLTPGTIPKTMVGGSSPKIEDSSITQSGSDITVSGSCTCSSLTGSDSGTSSTQGDLAVGGALSIPSIPASSGTRFLCINTSGVISSSASACSGT